ncbi:MAG: PAS domain-containing protein [Nostocales cyanobacterium]|nr:MAG: PAS domain-containing protein [Nostocales cyanobacterium]
MNIEIFYQRTQVLNHRLTDLYQTASVLPWIPSELLPQAFKELYTTSKMVQLAAEEMYQQNEELIQSRNLLETQRQHYQELFEFAPVAYLITDQQGIIKEANRAASLLLNIAQNFLIGKPIIIFIPQEQKEAFYSELIHISQSQQIQEILLPLKPRHSNKFDACLTVQSLPHNQEQPQTLHWVIRQIHAHQRLESTTLLTDKDLIAHRPIHKHSQGETISLNPLLIYYVNKGLVKLSTFRETGEEVLTGLATSGMVFSSSMTDIAIYQATALADVELVPIYLSETTTEFPHLNDFLLPKMQQRLKQTEAFLLIATKHKVQERLHYLLNLLKQQIGESVPEGTRLTFRLTHEDIASACGTTRVTITRLMGKLKQEGIISFDQKKHIICKDSP